MVDKDKIWNTVRKYFTISGNFIVNDDGTVDVQGDCYLKKSTPRLPVTFNKVSGLFVAKKMALESLVGSPRECDWLVCTNSPLKSLHGCPERLNSLMVSYCQLTSLQGCGQVADIIHVGYNPLESLRGTPEGVKELNLTLRYKQNFNASQPIQQRLVPIHVLAGLAAQQIYTQVGGGGYNHLEKLDLEKILNKYAGKGAGGILQCASELNEAGWEDWAEL